MYNYNNMYSNKDMSCPCNTNTSKSTFPKNYMYAQSYVPWQEINNTFDPARGLSCGTIFPELYSPYRPCQSMELIRFLESASKGGCAK